MNKKISLTLIIFISLLIVTVVGILTWNYVYYDVDSLFKDKKVMEVKSIIAKQNDKNKLFLEYANSSLNTFENPKVIVDPYDVGFKSALIIFNTPIETEISLYVNNNFIKTFEKSITHVIPISFESNNDNTIKIVTTEMASNEFIIKSKELDNNYVFSIKIPNGNYLYIDCFNNIYEMNALGKIYNAIYGIDDYSYQDNALNIKTMNEEEWVSLENFSTILNPDDFIIDDYIDQKNINFDAMDGKEYLLEDIPLKELPIREYIKELKNANKEYKFSIENDILILDTKSEDVSVIFVNKDNIYKIDYNDFLKLNVNEKTALYVVDDGVYYDLGIVIK